MLLSALCYYFCSQRWKIKTKKLFTEPGNLTPKELVELSSPQPFLPHCSKEAPDSWHKAELTALGVSPALPTQRRVLSEEGSPNIISGVRKGMLLLKMCWKITQTRRKERMG